MAITYNKLNEAVNAVFFDGQYQTVPVYIDLEDESRLELAEYLAIEPNELDYVICSSISSTLRWNESNIYSWHKENLDKWLPDISTSKPPFSALLLVFSLAAERMRQGENYSANNYYQRLCEMLGVTDDARKQKLSHAGKNTLIFWKALNSWLTLNDYAYGRPTAKPVNKWTYVSYALSQSLVRDADRKRFHRLFIDYGLSTHENLSELEIELYLHQWMTGSGPTAWLKKLWSVADLRERISSAALNELEVWDGEVLSNDGSDISTRRLSWMVSFFGFPKSKVKLFLATGSSAESEDTELIVDDSSTQFSKAAFEDCDHIWLSTLQNGDMKYLEPISKLNLDALLLFPSELTSNSGQIKYKHDARLVIPLVKVEGNPYYREVSHISLYSKHIILCHESIKERVCEHLEQFSRPGFIIKVGNSSNGLPNQWVLIQKIEVINAPKFDVHNDLQCLVPLSEGVNVFFSGGLKLAHNIWHAKAPPEVFASDNEGMLDVVLQTNEIGVKAKVLHREESTSFNPNFLASIQQSLESQNYIIAGFKGNRSKVEKDISFRTAETPRKFLPRRDVSLVYSLDKRAGKYRGFSATPRDEIEKDSVFLEGMILSGELSTRTLPDLTGKLTSLGINYNPETNTIDYNMNDVGSDAVSCILSGYHRWLVTPDNSSMTCQVCGAFQIVPSRKKRKKISNATNHANDQISKVDSFSAIKKHEDNVITADIVYDAICYLGSGTWHGLQSLLSILVKEPWQVTSIGRNLVDLGLVDIMLDKNNIRPSRWSCSSPAIVLTSSGNAYLSGFRNDTLLEMMQSSLVNTSKSYRVEKQKLAPSVHRWEFEDISIGELESLLSDVFDSHGRPVKVVTSPAESIILEMPSINETIEQQHSIHIEDRGDIEKFEPMTGKWQQSKLLFPGAYRTFFGGRKYFCYDADNTFEASFELVKLIAAREAGVYLHGYNNETNSFECVVGCEPPGLYRKALVSCSGMLPKLENGKLIYSYIPLELAALLMHKLYK